MSDTLSKQKSTNPVNTTTNQMSYRFNVSEGFEKFLVEHETSLLDVAPEIAATANAVLGEEAGEAAQRLEQIFVVLDAALEYLVELARDRVVRLMHVGGGRRLMLLGLHLFTLFSSIKFDFDVYVLMGGEKQ